MNIDVYIKYNRPVESINVTITVPDKHKEFLAEMEKVMQSFKEQITSQQNILSCTVLPAAREQNKIRIDILKHKLLTYCLCKRRLEEL